MYPVFDKSEYKRLLKRRFFEIPKRFFRDIKYCIQRIRRGYCDKDIWSIDYWFLHTVPDMLLQMQNTRYGSPVMTEKDQDGNDVIMSTDESTRKWDETLGQMAFLLKEADEETCSRKNLYEDEYLDVVSEFHEKYGDFGARMDDNEIAAQGRRVIHFPSELPEYEEICRQYTETERELEKYRDKCKNKALEMFSEHFWDLWD